jgi:hypothetical protein
MINSTKGSGQRLDIVHNTHTLGKWARMVVRFHAMRVGILAQAQFRALSKSLPGVSVVVIDSDHRNIRLLAVTS